MAPYARMIRPDMTVVASIASEHNRSFDCLELTHAEKKGRSHQQLDRISLAMMEKTVRRNAVVCRSRGKRYQDCPMLERGWNDLRFIILMIFVWAWVERLNRD
jgi:hypothetical protein